MGIVFSGLEQETNKKVAIKILDANLIANESIVERFKNEVINIKHQNILKMLDFVEKNGIYHNVSELLEGENLNEKIKKTGTINETEAINITNKVLDGLESLHDNNIIHRDIKPSNIFLCTDGTIKLMDFGIAKVLDTIDDKQKTAT